MNVSACLVTRGDHDLTPITDSLTASGIDDIVIYDNSQREDLAVYGRYAAIAEAKHDLVMTQDDDCVLPVSSIEHLISLSPVAGDQFVVANMPQSFRHDFYSDHCLVGFGAVFHRDLPARAFKRFFDGHIAMEVNDLITGNRAEYAPEGWLPRTCDIVFTALTPRVLVDLEYRDLPWAEDETRMYRSEGHVGERTRMLELVRQVRDA